MPATATRRKRSSSTQVQARKAGRTSARRRSTPPKQAPKRTGLPAWSDLSAKNGQAAAKKQRPRQPGLVDAVPTARFAALLVIGCALFTLYVGHVYATQALASEVQQLQKENLRLVLKHNRLRGEFDRMTSPDVILRRAAALGLEPASDYAPTIVLRDAD